ncbi:MAG: hypothetical protein WCM76_13820 [Bacteroidota bacterium]
MKNKLVIIFSLLTLIAYGQNKTVTINNYNFSFNNISEYNENGDSIIRVEVLRDKTKLLTHTINEIIGDCNSESVELGCYDIVDSTIIFYSYWTHAGDAPASPYGARKQIYTVDPTGKLLLTKSEIYIEAGSQSKENRGIEFLFSSPKNDFEKKELSVYIDAVEKKYNAKFVAGKSKDVLLKEVKIKLDKQIKKTTKHWKSLYADKIGGYKI